MSTRTSIVAEPDSQSQELAEGMYGVPLFWIPMIAPDELNQHMETGLVSINRKRAVERLENSISFVSEQFPDIDEMEDVANKLIAHLKKAKAKTIGIDIGEPMALDPENFPTAMTNAVVAIDSSDKSLKCKVGRENLTVRDVLCMVSTLDPDNGVVEEEQMIGMLW